MNLSKTIVPLAAVFAASLANAQTYTYDNGTTENALSFNAAAEIGFLHGFDAGTGDVIQEVRFSIGTALMPAVPNALDGNPVRFAILADPNGDGNPNDATLLYQSPMLQVSQSNLDTKVSYPVQPGVQVTGSYFVAVVTINNPNEFPVGLDINGFQPGEIAYIFGDATAIDLNNLGASSIGPIQQSNAVFLLDAIGGGSMTLGLPFCDPGLPNSTGASTLLAAYPNGLAAPSVRLESNMGPPAQFGYFLVGTIPHSGTQISQGLLCIGIFGAIGRYNRIGTPLGSLGRFDALGDLQNLSGTSTTGMGFDIPLTVPIVGSPAIQSGQTWHFQLWHREAGGFSNFSNGLSITF